MENQIAVFEQKQIRRLEHAGETFFSAIDIIAALTDSADPKNYWSKLKERDPQTLTVCQSFKMLATDGKQRKTDCANTEGVLRIIMSVPSPKAEPFKMWLAGLGKQAIDEAADPELGLDRLRDFYKLKGYSDGWIGHRLQSIDTRKNLTDEWKKRGVKEGQEYAQLTAVIAKGTLGLTPSEHSKLKSLDGQNLRDHMSELELIFTALSEAATRIYTEKEDAQGFMESREAAEKGGTTGGNARRNFERETGQQVVSSENFLKKLEEEDPKNELPDTPQ